MNITFDLEQCDYPHREFLSKEEWDKFEYSQWYRDNKWKSGTYQPLAWTEPQNFTVVEDTDFSDDPDELWFSWKVVHSALVPDDSKHTQGSICFNTKSTQVTLYRSTTGMLAVLPELDSPATWIRKCLTALVLGQKLPGLVQRSTAKFRLASLIQKVCVPYKDGMDISPGPRHNQVKVSRRGVERIFTLAMDSETVVTVTSPFSKTYQVFVDTQHASLRRQLGMCFDSLTDEEVSRPAPVKEEQKADIGGDDDDDDTDIGSDDEPRPKKAAPVFQLKTPAGEVLTYAQISALAWVGGQRKDKKCKFSLEKDFALCLVDRNLPVPPSLQGYLRDHNYGASKTAINLVDEFKSSCINGTQTKMDAARLKLMKYISDVEENQ